MTLEDLLRAMIEEGASDLFLKTNSTPALRVDGSVRRNVTLRGEKPAPLDSVAIARIVSVVLNERQSRIFKSRGEVDTAYDVKDVGRFRVNVFRQRGRTGIVFRHIPRNVPSMEGLNLPADQLRKLCDMQRGLVLITGIAGSGKSTCLAAMVDYINSTSPRHIITIEDPIEFTHDDKLCVIEHRELGLDTESFASALKHCVRQSPDVILIGEMRDHETMAAALNAAETGHLVLSTLHTRNAVQTVERILGYFPPHLHNLVRMQLTLVLEGVVSLRLLRRRDRPGRIPAAEILMATPTVREILQEGRTRQLSAALRDGAYFGTQTFGQCLKKLLDAGMISEEEAMATADNPDELKLEIKGILRGGELRFRKG